MVLLDTALVSSYKLPIATTSLQRFGRNASTWGLSGSSTVRYAIGSFVNK